MDNIRTRVRILHLDDNPSDAKLISALIEEADDDLSASVESVLTKEAYLAALRSCAFDLILSDFRMPGYDGDEALKDARAICPDIPFIMVTGELGEERAVETLKAGATDYVLKDRMVRLVPSIKRALKDARLERERRESDRKYRTIVETAREGIVFAKAEGPYSFVNQRMAEMLGYSVEEILGKSSLDFADEEWSKSVLRGRQELQRGEFAEGEFKFRRKDGSELWTRYS
ncbi:PAS domain S-box protein, partial [bacterium]